MELHSNSNLHSCKTLFSLKKEVFKKGIMERKVWVKLKTV